MTHKFTKFNNDDRAFSGLEAAIVLIAFVVVAAVFSIAVVNAGFFTTQEAVSSVYRGVQQASSAIQLGYPVVAYVNLTTPVALSNVTTITFPIMLAAGGRPVDLSPNRTAITYTDADFTTVNLHDNRTTLPIVNISWPARFDTRPDEILEFGEVAQITVQVGNITSAAAIPGGPAGTPPVTHLSANEVFTITVQTPHGAALSVTRRLPVILDTNRTTLLTT